MPAADLSLADARAAVAAAVPAVERETVALADALGRILVEPVTAAGDVPRFANSAMDGFALRSGAAGRRLAIVGESRAGAPADVAVDEGQAVRISTGAAVPEGADAILPVELATVEDGVVVVGEEVAPGRHVRRPGEDLRAGQPVLDAGAVLGAAELALAAIAGRAELAVGRRPRVAVLVTGDELRAPGEPLGPGQIVESNGLALSALARRAGATVAPVARVADRPDEVERALGGALEQADVVLVSGGVSVGPHDHVKPALERLGVAERFWRVALRPGRPLWFGTRGRTLVFGLPGNPVSSLVTFSLFAAPALRALQGAAFGPPGVHTARAATAIPAHPGRAHAVRVTLASEPDGALTATPTGRQESHLLTSMLAADGIALVGPDQGDVPAGAPVTVELL